MKIIHVSDMHGRMIDLDYADLYIFTGDMYPDFIKSSDDGSNFRINKEQSKIQQDNWAKNNNWRKHLKNENAPIVTVAGNHDFTTTSQLFGGEVYEIINPTDIFCIGGFKIGGFRGIEFIVGEWNDETYSHDFVEVLKQLPKDLDIIVSHTPPKGILDKSFGSSYGCNAYASHLNLLHYENNAVIPKLCCFGHIHCVKIEKIESTIFSNAATGYNEILIEKEDFSDK